MISKRSRGNEGELSSLIAAHFECTRNRFHPTDNPDGAINLGTAEDYLMDDYNLARVAQPLAMQSEHLHYSEPRGIASLRQALAVFMTEISGLHGINPDNVIVAAGAGSILESIAYNLFDRDDALITPAPYYSGYDHDFGTRFGVKIVPAYMDARNHFRFEMDRLDDCYKRTIKSGQAVKALLINSPNNPLGQLYSIENLENIVAFARSHQLHIIADEIYTHSIFDSEQQGYKSLLEIDPGYRDHIHRVYGIAKDFALSGFRVGFCYSENEQLLEGMKTSVYFSNVSTHSQVLTETLLSDLPACRKFFAINRQKLLAAFQHLQSELQQCPRLEYLHTQAGHFVFIDFSHYLQPPTFEAELALFDDLFSQTRVNITPGQYFKCNTPGWFRLCFANHPEVVSEALRRLTGFLGDYSTGRVGG